MLIAGGWIACVTPLEVEGGKDVVEALVCEVEPRCDSFPEEPC